LRICEHLITGTVIALLYACCKRLGLKMERFPSVVRWWQARLCRAIGMRVEVVGEIIPNTLMVANHVSWLDIPIIGSQGPIGFVSKAEVREWPLIGWMAEIAGTLFIRRGANEAGQINRQIEQRIGSGRPIVVFPEGTTSDGTRLLRFHPRLLAAGQCEGVRVQPVALRYGTNKESDPDAPFLGEDTLLAHLSRLVRRPELRVQLRFLDPVDGSRLTRREIAEHCHSVIAKAIGADAVADRHRTADSAVQAPLPAVFESAEPI
jgi:1-acyl-sn-glycerol-3-phosphate acyltransferase